MITKTLTTHIASSCKPSTIISSSAVEFDYKSFVAVNMMTQSEAVASNSISTSLESRDHPSFLITLSTMIPPKQPAEKIVPTNTMQGAKYSEFQHIFRYIDKDGDDKISPAELADCMRNAGQEICLEGAADVVESADSDGDGLLSFDDFVKLVEVEEEEEKRRSLREAFGVYEMEGQGCITPSSLSRALGMLGDCKSIEECEVMIQRFDADGDGAINFQEFCFMML